MSLSKKQNLLARSHSEKMTRNDTVNPKSPPTTVSRKGVGYNFPGSGPTERDALVPAHTQSYLTSYASNLACQTAMPARSAPCALPCAFPERLHRVSHRWYGDRVSRLHAAGLRRVPEHAGAADLDVGGRAAARAAAVAAAPLLCPVL